MAKRWKKLLVWSMVFSLCAGTVYMPVNAEEEVINNPDGTVTIVMTTTTPSVDPETNEVQLVIDIDKETTGTNNNGQEVYGEDHYDQTTVKSQDGTLISDTVEEDGYLMTVNADGSSETVGYEGGSNTVTEERTIQLEADVSLTDTDDPQTEQKENETVQTGAAAGTILDQTGDIPTSSEDGEYDYTTVRVEKPGSVTITTESVEFTKTDSSDKEEDNLKYVHSGTDPEAPDKDKDGNVIEGKEGNDLATDNNPSYLPDYPDENEKVDVTEGYDYQYLGFGNHSMFFAAKLYKSPGYEGETPVYTDENGVSYYRRRKESETLDTIQNPGNSANVEGFYLNGELVEGYNKHVGAVWANITQYVLIDAETNELITTYCADLDTSAEFGYSYNMTNVKDSSYYTKEQAEMIIEVSKNGYWGTVDDPNTKEKEYGSLEAVKEMMRNALDQDNKRIFTDDEVDALTDGAAMTATQYAIWHFSNQMSDVSFNNVYYLKDPEGDGIVRFGSVGDVPEHKQAAADVAMKLYNYLVNLKPQPAKDKTTANTIINEDNFIEKVSLNVLKKAEEHVNNQDDDKDNDAYVTDISFKLVVEPARDEDGNLINGDSMLIKIYSGNDTEPIAVGRIAGTLQDGEVMLEGDGNGNYTFKGIVLTEGNKNFHITLDGIQNLEQGVYLYTSEVREGDPFPTSQTMVGVASGAHTIDIAMDINFAFSVEDEVIAIERQWRTEWTEENPVNPYNEYDPEPYSVTPGPNPEPEVLVEIPDGGVPLVELFDEEIPLANVPMTGDSSVNNLFMIMLSACGILAVITAERKAKHTKNETLS